MCEIRCKRCGRTLKNQKSKELGYGPTCYRIVQLQKIQPEKLDMIEIKHFITSEIQRVFRDSNFNRIATQHNDSEIVPIKVDKPPNFDPIEVDKRLVIKELKNQLEKGIKNILYKVGSFDDQIAFIEIPVEIST